MTLMNKKIVLGITGGIAAYKAADLCRRLKEVGADVRVVMTKAAKQFISKMTLQALSGHPVHDDLWDLQAEAAMGHIELARFAELIIIAPASADCMARLAHGMANDLLTTICLASKAPVILAPAMNQQMWQAEALQYNRTILQTRGVTLLGPADGSQACGDIGPGRMLEPTQIIEAISQILIEPFLIGKKIVITAGPTQEHLDPIRYLTNHSSGKMGFALAEQAVNAGAIVTLISGPVQLKNSDKIKRIDVTTAEEMLAETVKACENCDIFISAAAVADYRFAEIYSQKLKKHSDQIQFQLIKNSDILATVAKQTNKPFCVGFAAETENLSEHALAKLTNKHIDMLIANEVGRKDIGFHSDDNAVTIFTKQTQKAYPKQNKNLLAKQILQEINYHYEKKSTNKNS